MNSSATRFAVLAALTGSGSLKWIVKTLSPFFATVRLSRATPTTFCMGTCWRSSG
jgi:hypothetical protein